MNFLSWIFAILVSVLMLWITVDGIKAHIRRRKFPPRIKWAVKECEHFIECAERMDFDNPEDSWNFLDAGIDVHVRQMQEIENRYPMPFPQESSQ